MLFKKVHENASIPTRGTPYSAGFDLSACEDVVIPQTGTFKVRTGICGQIPRGHYGQLALRSGFGSKNTLALIGGVIDCDYTGEIIVIMTACGNGGHLKCGERFAQMVVIPIYTGDSQECNQFPLEYARGESGFGSTGQFGQTQLSE